jgi:minor histocompatibility antigen H13
MAEAVDDIVKTINETNGTNTETFYKRIPATTEGMLIAYTSLVIMALVPIFLGSFRSVRLHMQNKVSIFNKIVISYHYDKNLI